MSHLPLWYLGQISEDICDKVLEELSQIPGQDAAMGSDGSNKEHSTRNTTVRFAPQDYWLSEYLEKFALDANNVCGWNYNITSKESIQLAEYTEGQHYAWHTDTFTLSGQPEDRKITVVVLLNNDFTGGEFDVKLYSEYTVPLTKGSMVAFPSILEHRVLPVLTGTRYSATLWFKGPRFI